jgi:hypothetical protein
VGANDHPLPSPDSPPKQPAPIRIAWSLCFAWGLVLVVPSVVILVPLASTPRAFIGAMGFLSIVVIIGIAYCFSGYLIHRQRRSGAWFTAILVVLTTALQFSMHLDFQRVDMKPPWLIVNALLFILLVTNWSRFRAG